MHKELRKYSSIGNKPGLLLLCKTILTQPKVTLDSARTSCSFVNGCDVNLNCGLLAFEDLNLIKLVDNNCICINPIFSSFTNDKAVTILCETTFTFLIEENLVNIELLKYNDSVDLFYIPKRAFSLQCSVFRNLLISFNALIPSNDEFRIAKEYDKFFGKLIKRVLRKLTLEQLQKKLIEEQEMGEQGEIFVLNFERKRKPFLQCDLERIRQISHIDVSAGYDIISFHDEISLKRRYIEVKTFRGKTHFYWSAHEIESAKIRGNDYFIYLVDANRMNDENYIPEIIQNPYLTVYQSKDWALSPSSFLVERI